MRILKGPTKKVYYDAIFECETCGTIVELSNCELDEDYRGAHSPKALESMELFIGAAKCPNCGAECEAYYSDSKHGLAIKATTHL